MKSEEATELTAYCGLYYGDCIRYKSKAADLARDLLDEMQLAQWDKYAEISSDEAFQYYQQSFGVLEAIVGRKCDGACRATGGCQAFSCKIVECCKNKVYEGCWECDGFENCGEFEFLRPFHGDTPVRNLRIIAELGLEGWEEHRHKFYVWQ